ncbi:type I polyketide synthase [Nocardiopsis sp. Huas11]|uniref:type I polyketide synthase n=1 Tax=Nocardiopsis sp. Huas11 TaxID=2183912 RepID=UPI001315877F|nr:type I polyketide synthase [Nocardiopsis sp. Huas11]
MDEPVAVVGMGCRFPGGASGVDAFWDLLVEGRSGVVEVPPDRWDLADFHDEDPEAEGRTYSRHGGFVDGAADFDAGLFGVPPREAVGIDPQHRFVLEVAWEALENAGIAPDSLKGSRTGVFVGMGGSDYERLRLAAGGSSFHDGYTATGSALNFAANRLSYALGLEGPSLVVDTACSSSLVALHLACQSLRAGECDTAIVAGVSLMLDPGTTVALSKGRMLSPRGACRTFDAAADGYVRGEGCGVVVLRRASSVEGTHSRVRALVRGSATNQDGRSNGLTAPRGAAQEDVVARALAAGGVRPADVGYVEAHGTGTPLGDPIEVRALAAVLGEGRDASDPVVLGSVKTNIGHLEAAAGIAGLIKTVLAVERGAVPPHLNVTDLNPVVPWDRLPLEVGTELRPWTAERRVAGVSSFGFGGTNAHAVLESVPSSEGAAEEGEPVASARAPVVVKVSGRGEAALRDGAARLAAWARSARDRGELDDGLAGVAWSAGTGRADLPDRAAVVASSPDELVAGLDAVALGRGGPGLARGRRGAGGAPRVAFVVPGQGPRLAGALSGVYGRVPAVTEVVDEVAAVVGPVSELPLSVLLDDSEEAAEALMDTAVVQPCLFAVAVALGRWWESVGVRADVVLGHSAGAYAAAVLSGVFTVGEGARLTRARARLMGALPPVGAMAAVFCPAEDLAALDELRHGQVVIASYNGPRENVVSGPTEQVLAVMETMAGRGVKSARLRVSYASHGPLMESVLPDLGAAFEGIHPREPDRDLVSDSTGELAGATVTTADYWVRHTRRPVLFSAAMRTVLDRGARVVVELGPGGLLPLFLGVAGDREPVCVPSVLTEEGVYQGLMEAVAQVWAAGVDIDWARVNGPGPGVAPTLPTYPFQRRPYWADNAVPVPPDGERGTRGRTPPRAVPPPEETVPDVPAAPLSAFGAAGDREGADQISALVTYLRGALASVMELDEADTLDQDAGLFDLGITSAMVVRLRKMLERDLGTRVRTTAVFEHPTIRQLARHLADLGAAPQAPDAASEPVADTAVTETDTGEAAVAPPTTAVERPASSDTEPIAIVGMACRFPGGADTPDAYWRLLREGRDATSGVPADRWDAAEFAAPGRDHAFRGGFLTGPVDRFDAEAFGITPREARHMDPQQRLLLEVTWEALEDAGIPASAVEGSRTGVFVGVTTADYLQLLTTSGALDADPYVATGNTASVAAGRLSYVLGAQGPSMAIDTACSSSLVAAHLAARSLRSGESDTALVAGVNLMLSPATTVGLINLGALAPDGRCKTFDAAADGYARGEGAGALVLKRLTDAVADGDRVWAVIRGSAVNQDGRSAGLTVPNGRAQQAVIGDALRDAAAAPEEIGYVEAHGTGTALGDPIELEALTDVLRPEATAAAPVVVGSVKTNIGHLEAAAGVSGLIKVALSLKHGRIPPHLHMNDPNPNVDWSHLPVRIPTEDAEWTCAGPRTAGISSFGFSGTNAHMVLAQAPDDAARVGDGTGAPEEDVPAVPRAELLTLSAHGSAAVSALAADYGALLGRDDAPRWADVTAGAALRRSHLPVRMAVAADSAERAVELLAEAADGRRVRGLATGTAVPEDQRRLILAYSGQGSQWAGMGLGLLADPVCADVLRRCEKLVRELAGWSLSEVLGEDGAVSRLTDTEYAQPAIVAVQAALTERWRAWGLEPDAVVGHSVGEIGAAYAAGALDLDHAMAVAVARGRVMASTRGSGAMAAVGLPPHDVAELIAPLADRLFVAAVNGPEATVVAGDPAALAELEPLVRDRRARWARIQEEYAFHSPLMVPVQDELVRALPPLAPKPAAVAAYSTVTGERAGPDAFDTDYWARNLVSPVRYRDAMRAAAVDRAHNVVLEVGPHAVLGSPSAQSLRGRVADATVLTSMRARQDPRTTMLEAAGGLYVLDFDLDHRAIQPTRRHWVPLPHYPWQRERHWVPDRPVPRGAERPPSAAADAVEEGLNRHTYETEWRAADAVRQSGGEGASGAWLLVADGSGVADGIARELARIGERSIVVGADRLDLGAPDTLRELVAGTEGLRGLVHCATLDVGPVRGPGTELDDALTRSCGPLLSAVRALDGGPGAARIWVVTRGGAGVAGTEPAHAPVWGLGRVVALEHPELWGGLIDLDPGAADPDADAAAVTAEITGGDGEDQVAYRAGERRVARLRRAAPLPAGPGPVVHGDAAYLVTGGRGSLGLRVARWLVGHGARHLILTGRRPLPEDPDDSVTAAVGALRDAGATVHTPAVDVADAEGMAALFTQDAPWPAIRGVVHAAGAFHADTVREMDWERFRAVLRPKVEGTLVLDAVADGLDFLVMFSSASAVWGSAAAGHYAAANHFEDVMAWNRADRGLPGLAVDWGWWSGSDLVDDEHLRYFQSMGLDVLPDPLGFGALDRLLSSDRTQVTVAPVDWSRFRPVLEAKRRRPLLELMDGSGVAAAAVDRALLDRLGTATGAARTRLMEERIQREVGAVIGRRERLDRHSGFFEAGMDSIMSVELKTRLEQALGVELPATIAFEHPTVADLADFLLDEVLPLTADTGGGDGPPHTPEQAPGLDDLSEVELLELLSDELEQS